MARRLFHKPVLIQPGRIDRDLIVTDVEMAAEVLLRRWPVENCPTRATAMRHCLRAIRGELPPSRARNAFVRAAKRAHILLSDDPAL